MFKFGNWGSLWAFFITAPSLLALLDRFDPLFIYFKIDSDTFLRFVHALSLHWNYWHGLAFDFITERLPYDLSYNATERNLIIVVSTFAIPIGFGLIKKIQAELGSKMKHPDFYLHLIMMPLAFFTVIYGPIDLGFNDYQFNPNLTELDLFLKVMIPLLFGLGFQSLFLFNRPVALGLLWGVMFWLSLEVMYLVPGAKHAMMWFAEFAKSLPQH